MDFSTHHVFVSSEDWMTRPADPITEYDLNAYVDAQLDEQRRIEVEDYLAARPEAASRVMADLRARDALRAQIPAGHASRPSLRTVDAARRLQRGLVLSRFFEGIRRTAAIVALVALGWVAHAEFGGNVRAGATAPSFVDDAVMSHRTALVRASMHSQREAPDYDREEIRAITQIVMPPLPRDWHVVDVQVFPSKQGPSVEMAIKQERLGTMSLFAVRSPSFAVIKPTLVHRGTEATVFWQVGELAYALTGTAAGQDLERAAVDLAASLY
jgi:anti-sigma factor RsiW